MIINDSMEFCRNNIERMLKFSQTKVIFPIITLGLVQAYYETKQYQFSDKEIRICYVKAVKYMQAYLQHNLHIGGKYYDAYPSRNLPKYGVVKAIDNKCYELLPAYSTNAEMLISWIPEKINQYITDKLGLIPQLLNYEYRHELAVNQIDFINLIKVQIEINPTNFEIFSFAIIKVHLEKFACKIYRDTRTSANDGGIDISTNFGVVYQIKKLKVYSYDTADNIYEELKMNFNKERLSDGNVILIIDDISKEIKNYLINMKVQSINKNEILKLADQFEDVEDREKILRIAYEEFEREYLSNIK
ncbi:hypothetical protein H6G81_13095 [Scytonema hofmannii FACHB-248]|uniref:Restriction endonuclease n=1 Tax=Scytonema hofmannii FACHB-248 TaxID=1842502 RepID=A0ABR8GPZ0_9CYAN|nr:MULTISPECIES: hypothetical protein [Nostocales]MBD2605442.1 hypothetical protein [Scytonema hofmannii FACHB-248]